MLTLKCKGFFQIYCEKEGENIHLRIRRLFIEIMENTWFPRLAPDFKDQVIHTENKKHTHDSGKLFILSKIEFFFPKYQYFNQIEVNITVAAGSMKSRQATVVTFGPSRWKQPCLSFHTHLSCLCSTKGKHARFR